MSKLLEHEVFAEMLGYEVNNEHLANIGVANGCGYGSYADSLEFIISHVNYHNSVEYCRLFRLTDSIKERWDINGIDFSIYIYSKDNKIIGGHIFKYKETSSSIHFHPTGYEMEPTQQEIRIAKRILEYITEKGG